MGNFVVAGKNDVVVVSGGCCMSDTIYVVEGFAWKTWCLSTSMRMSLEMMTVYPSVSIAETKNGIPINVRAVAQVRFMRDEDYLKKACEHFIGIRPHEIQDIINNTFAGKNSKCLFRKLFLYKVIYDLYVETCGFKQRLNSSLCVSWKKLPLTSETWDLKLLALPWSCGPSEEWELKGIFKMYPVLLHSSSTYISPFR